MQQYIKAFKEASELTDSIAGGLSNYPLRIDPGFMINIPKVIDAIASDLSDFLPHTDVLPGMCFRAARELSYILLELGVRHTVTVGDIELVDGLYVGLDLEQLQRDVAGGYVLDSQDGRPVGRPINAHAWITLENGCVIDTTILPSQHRKSQNPSELLSFAESVYFSGKQHTPVVRHIPMMTGLVYHQLVLIGEGDGDAQNYCQWSEDYARLMGRLDLVRLVPALRPN
ncbi:hypothetical protein QO021_30265 (plasmid) [Pseudomonas amygdali pv. lachrymans]|uniref:hypothetical protein n=1 Tax=Pseudomonas amygdali TaxID=47877 RepID=UPI0006B94833|nr:hypothetical protein [Pseudomonas amygdali]RMM39285.1 hypothetical protein ALQ79_200028 [Pseudomonas amygdali pv. lachrymans]WIO61373.1 hypothetical protein QO021_30265 [Pseudomonas amygdali pv. lachrymans]